MSRILAVMFMVFLGLPLHAQTLWQFDSTSGSAVGKLLRMDADFAVAAEEPALKIAAGELIALQQGGTPLPALPNGPVLMLQNGDRWPGSLAGGKGLALEWNLSLGSGKSAKPTIAIPAVRAIWFTAVPDPDDDAANFRWVDPRKNQDSLLLRNGDVLKGTLAEIAADGRSIRFKSTVDADAKTIPVEQLAAIAFDPSLARNRTPKGAYAKAVLRNGSRLTLASCTTDGKSWQCKLTTGSELAFPLTELVALNVLQGKAIDLADLTPKSSKVEPFNSLVWNWQPNRNVKGKPLWLTTAQGEECFDRGLGTHSKTTLEYDLAGKYRRFETLIGLDSRTGKKGHAAVSIAVDGKLQIIPGLANLKPGPAVPVRIEIAKARTLTLTIDFSLGGDVQDDVNWANARLIE